MVPSNPYKELRGHRENEQTFTPVTFIGWSIQKILLFYSILEIVIGRVSFQIFYTTDNGNSNNHYDKVGINIGCQCVVDGFLLSWLYFVSVGTIRLNILVGIPLNRIYGVQNCVPHTRSSQTGVYLELSKYFRVVFYGHDCTLT